MLLKKKNNDLLHIDTTLKVIQKVFSTKPN